MTMTPTISPTQNSFPSAKPRLSEAQKKRLANAFMTLPVQEREPFLDRMQSVGMDFDIYEYTPLNFFDEARGVEEVAKEAATFGAYEAQMPPNVGDTEAFGIEFQPSRIPGEIIGALPGIVAGYGVGSKVARMARPTLQKLAKGTVGKKVTETALTVSDDAARAAAASRAARLNQGTRTAERAITIGIGETLPGFMNGYIRSDGDFNQAIAMAAEWAAMGLILEGTFAQITKGLGNARAGKPLTEKMRAGLSQFHGMVTDGASTLKQKTMSRVNENLGDLAGGVLGQRLTTIAEAVSRQTNPITRAEFFENGREMFEEVLTRTSTFTQPGIDVATETFEKFHRNMYGRVRTGNMTKKEIQDSYNGFFGDMNDAWEKFNGPGRVVDQELDELVDQVLRSTNEESLSESLSSIWRGYKQGAEFSKANRADFDDLVKQYRAEGQGLIQARKNALQDFDLIDLALPDLEDVETWTRSRFEQLQSTTGRLRDKFKGIREVDFIPHKPGTSRVDELAAALRDGVILLNPRVLLQKFNDKAWTIPKVKGVKPLAEDAFQTLDEWKQFVIEHELTHSIHARAKGMSEAAYENKINQMALRQIKKARRAVQGDPRVTAFKKDMENWWETAKEKAAGAREKISDVGDDFTEAGSAAIRRNVSEKNLDRAAGLGRLAEDKLDDAVVRISDQIDRESGSVLSVIRDRGGYLWDQIHDIGDLLEKTGGSAARRKFLQQMEKFPAGAKKAEDFSRYLNKVASTFQGEKTKEVISGLGKDFNAAVAYIRERGAPVKNWFESDIKLMKKGDQGEFILDGDKTPVRATVIESSDTEGFFTLQTIDGEEQVFHVSQIDAYRKAPSSKARGGAGRDPNYKPITDDNYDQLMKLHADYRRTFGEAPQSFGKDRFGDPRDPDKYIRRLDNDRARDEIRSLMFSIGQKRNTRRDADFINLDRGSFEAKSKFGQATSEAYRAALGEDTLVGWLANLMPTYARHGLSANKPISIEVRRMLHQMEEWGKKTDEFLSRYRAALEPLGMPMKNRLQSMVPGKIGAESKMMKHKVNAQKIKLARALDSDAPEEFLRDATPEFKAAYTEIRKITDELADHLGLPKGERIANYFPHIFHGSVGQFMAKDLAQELKGTTSRGRFMVAGSENYIPNERMFASLLEREGAEGFEWDLDAAMYAYIKGAVKKPGMDEMLRRSKNLLDDLPLKNNKGGEHTTRQLFREYVQYLSGQPGAGRVAAAQFWQDAKFFNHWTDRLVAYLGGGGPEIAEAMGHARHGRLAENAARNDYTVAAEAKARQYFKTLVDDANVYTKEGELKDVPGTKRHRASLALKVDELRNALQDPKAKPLVISHLYGVMVVNKLGLNFSHGLINLTQTLTNTYPTIGVRNTAKGMAKFVGDRGRLYENGVPVQRVLDDMGVLSDTAEAQEFLRPGLGWKQELLDDYVMAPARISEQFNRGVAGLGAYEKALGLGKSHEEAIEFARDLVLKTQFPFNKAGVSPIMQTPMARFLLMFKSYPMHQLNFSYTLLEDAFKKRDAESISAFTSHVMSYMALAGMGATALDATSFGWKAQHPITDIVEMEDSGDLAGVVGGPPSAALIDLLHGQVMSAAREVFIPTWHGRAERALEAPTVGQSVLEMTGMSR